MKRALPGRLRDDKNLAIIERRRLNDASIAHRNAPQRPGVEKMRLTDVEVEH